MQGDILSRTSAIEEILKKVHPHYFDKGENKYFIVLTQDCDLVRRDGKPCDARYISLAPIRPLRIVIQRQLEEYLAEGFTLSPPVCSKRNEARFRNFLERLLNNNESSYFYLHREPEKEFPEDCCAFLALSIAIKAQFHYQSCVDAKILELRDTFRAKLGWLVGQMYSRIGTEDLQKSKLNSAISEIVNKSSVWVEDKKLKDLCTQLEDWKIKNPGAEIDEQVINTLVKTIPKRKDQVLNQIINILMANSIVNNVNETKLRNLIRNDNIISGLIPD
ncbi:MAG: hypothetical protein IPO79_18080 [Flavobacteriales bacterium]|nr:hypothetical protein [Flavobacteriales bacterium]